MASPCCKTTTLDVLLADGNGGYRPARGSPITLGKADLGSVAIGDFNGDGKLDLAVTSPGAVSVLLGNGDGTFHPAPGSPISSSGDPLQVVVADVNGDGKADLVLLNADNSVSVLLGNGDGTFTAAPGPPVQTGGGRMPGSVSMGDFNGDGKPDLAVVNPNQGTLSILLGNGDGTFTPAPGSPIMLGGAPSDVVVGDFNADGKADLAVGGAPSNGVSVLLGRGDGTFQPASGSPIMARPGEIPDGIAVSDLNSDGKQDLAFAAASGSTVGTSGLYVEIGDGTGRFTPAHGSPFSVSRPGQSPVLLAGGTFDGRPGLVLTPNWFFEFGPVLSVLLTALPSDPPTAALSVNPNPALTGTQAVLDASGSSDPLDRPIADYRWDLGSGRFDHDTGASPTITERYTNPGTVRVRVQITNSAGETAIATAYLVVQRPRPTPSAIVAGYVKLCGGPAPGRCRIRATRICTPSHACVTSDRVAAINSRGRRVAVGPVRHGRFRLDLKPGDYTIVLLGDGKRVHARVMRRKRVTARGNRTTTVRFLFAVP